MNRYLLTADNITTSLWSMCKAVDMVVQRLAIIEIVIENESKRFTIPKYSQQMVYLAPRVPVYKPTPEFAIYLSDLSPRILRYIHSFDQKTREDIFLLAGRRLFTKFFPRYYTQSIAESLNVRIDK
ncbi:MAG: hypothetical protein WBL67_19225 [Nitrososphaeraceae archaeon]